MVVAEKSGWPVALFKRTPIVKRFYFSFNLRIYLFTVSAPFNFRPMTTDGVMLSAVPRRRLACLYF